jgi:hypothetical protein
MQIWLTFYTCERLRPLKQLHPNKSPNLYSLIDVASIGDFICWAYKVLSLTHVTELKPCNFFIGISIRDKVFNTNTRTIDGLLSFCTET